MGVRRIEAEDMPAVAHLCGQWGYPATAEQVLQRFRRLEADPYASLYVAVAEDGSLAV